MVGTAEENGTVAEVGDMRAGDNDPDLRIIVTSGCTTTPSISPG